jgi:hypothetical protein
MNLYCKFYILLFVIKEKRQTKHVYVFIYFFPK